jgi:multiple sugar transport system substrate-binding protein
VSSATEHPEEAWRFAQWLVSPESQALMGGGGYYWPSVLTEQQTFVDYWADKGVNVEAFGPGEDALVQFPVQNNFNEADILLNQLLEPMWLGQATPDDTLSDADEQVNAIE